MYSKYKIKIKTKINSSNLYYCFFLSKIFIFPKINIIVEKYNLSIYFF